MCGGGGAVRCGGGWWWWSVAAEVSLRPGVKLVDRQVIIMSKLNSKRNIFVCTAIRGNGAEEVRNQTQLAIAATDRRFRLPPDPCHVEVSQGAG